MPVPVPLPPPSASRVAWLRRDPARRFQLELLPCLEIAWRAKGGSPRRANRNTPGQESPATTRSIAAAYRAYDALLARALRWPDVTPAHRWLFYRIHASARLMDAALVGRTKNRIASELSRCRELMHDDCMEFATSLQFAITWAAPRDRAFARMLRDELAAFIKRREAALQATKSFLAECDTLLRRRAPSRTGVQRARAAISTRPRRTR